MDRPLVYNKATNFHKDKDQLLIKIKNISEENDQLNENIKELNFKIKELMNKDKLNKRIKNEENYSMIFNNGYNSDNNINNNLRNNINIKEMNNINNNENKSLNILIDKTERRKKFLSNNKSCNKIDDKTNRYYTRHCYDNTKNTYFNYSNYPNNCCKTNYKIFKNDFLINTSSNNPKTLVIRIDG